MWEWICQGRTLGLTISPQRSVCFRTKSLLLNKENLYYFLLKIEFHTTHTGHRFPLLYFPQLPLPHLFLISSPPRFLFTKVQTSMRQEANTTKEDIIKSKALISRLDKTNQQEERVPKADERVRHSCIHCYES